MNIIIASNQISVSNIGIEELIIAGIGYVIVFASLVILFYVFSFIPKILNIQVRNKLKREGKEIKEEEVNVSGEVNAAISTALFLFFSELHDEESNVMTIKRISKTYSPWNSKIYGLRTFRKPN